MKLAIMQPYFLPYIGYFQLISAVDRFVLYDNIKYTKKGWINRNRMLLNGTDTMFSLPLQRDSDSLNVCNRQLAADFDRTKLLNQFKGAYDRAPYFEQIWPVLERIVRCKERNLFRYIYHSIVEMYTHLGSKTEILISSEININHALRAQNKVIALCEQLGADTYINTMGGMDLYSKEVFCQRGIHLQGIQSRAFQYAQFGAPFVPWLSIADVMMFNAPEQVTIAIQEGYELV